MFKLDLGLLSVTEASDVLSLDKQSAVAELDVSQGNRAVADSADDLAGFVGSSGDLERCLVVLQIEHGAMSSGIDDRSELTLLSNELFDFVGVVNLVCKVMVGQKGLDGLVLLLSFFFFFFHYGLIVSTCGGCTRIFLHFSERCAIVTLACSAEPGSIGALPPLGEAKTIS